MRELPILFSAPMVRAILAGTKTQTRRIIKETIPPEPAMDAIHPRHTAKHPAPYLDSYCGGKKTDANPRGMTNEWAWWTRDDRPGQLFKVRWVPGYRLWVKETAAVRYKSEHYNDCHRYSISYAADGSEYLRKGKCPSVFPKLTFNKDGSLRWHSAMFMPRWASRILLEITNVRVERLQSISEADVLAEGAPRGGFDDDGKFYEGAGTYRAGYAGLWDHINGAGSWDANPFVAVIEFRRIAQESPK